MRLQTKYPNAPYVYLYPTNVEEEFQKFIKNPVTNPVFDIRLLDHEQKLLGRLTQLQLDIKMHPDDTEFLKKRLLETRYLLTTCVLHKNPKSRAKFEAFQKLSSQIYSAPDLSMVQGILGYLKTLAATTGRAELFDKLIGAYKIKPGPLYMPAEKTFLHYQGLVAALYPKAVGQDSKADNTVPTLSDVTQCFADFLSLIGAEDWRVRHSSYGSNARVSYRLKEVVLGRHFLPATMSRLRQVAAHEVFGHIARYLSLKGAPTDSAEAEGFAIVFEQVMLPQFVYKRLLRYLAISIGYGLDGTPRNFMQTFELLLCAAQIIYNDPEKAKKSAFYETTRAFRNGLTSIPGAVVTKDLMYLEGNLQVWKKLESDLLTQKQFAELLHKHDTIAKEHL